MVATPPATGLVPSDVAPLKNSTVPAAPAPVTVAVRFAVAGATPAVGDTARAVVVVTATGAAATVMEKTLLPTCPVPSVGPWLVHTV